MYIKTLMFSIFSNHDSSKTLKRLCYMININKNDNESIFVVYQIELSINMRLEIYDTYNMLK